MRTHAGRFTASSAEGLKAALNRIESNLLGDEADGWEESLLQTQSLAAADGKLNVYGKPLKE